MIALTMIESGGSEVAIIRLEVMFSGKTRCVVTTIV
jgi:hypothetical protein